MLKLALDKWCTDGVYELCLCCLQGRETEANKEECSRLLKLTTNGGNADAAYSLAMELQGKNKEEAFALLKESEEVSLKSSIRTSETL